MWHSVESLTGLSEEGCGGSCGVPQPSCILWPAPHSQAGLRTLQDLAPEMRRALSDLDEQGASDENGPYEVRPTPPARLCLSEPGHTPRWKTTSLG